MQNILATIRTAHGLSQQALATRVGVSRQLVMRSEQALYVDPPPRLLDELMQFDYNEYSHETVIRLYHNFQHHQRLLHGPYGFTRNPLLVQFFDFKTIPEVYNPIRDWIAYTGQTPTSIAVGFCVHLQAMNILTNPRNKPPKKLPTQFLAALLEAGYKSSLLSDLSGALTRHRSYWSSVNV